MIQKGGEIMMVTQSVCGGFISKGGENMKVTQIACGGLFTLGMVHIRPGFSVWVRKTSVIYALSLWLLPHKSCSSVCGKIWWSGIRGIGNEKWNKWKRIL
jgi:hypothetical protein